MTAVARRTGQGRGILLLFSAGNVNKKKKNALRRVSLDIFLRTHKISCYIGIGGGRDEPKWCAEDKNIYYLFILN